MNRIVGGKLVDANGNVEHVNVNGYLTDFSMSIFSPAAKQRVEDASPKAQDVISSRLFVLTFEEDMKDFIPLKVADKEKPNNLQPLKLIPGEDDLIVGFSGKVVPELRLSSVSYFGADSGKLGYTYVGVAQ